jgi:hypothetical protein
MPEQVSLVDYEVPMVQRAFPFMELAEISETEATVLKTAAELYSEDPDFISEPIEVQLAAVSSRLGGEILPPEEIQGLLEKFDTAYLAEFFREL